MNFHFAQLTNDESPYLEHRCLLEQLKINNDLDVIKDALRDLVALEHAKALEINVDRQQVLSKINAFRANAGLYSKKDLQNWLEAEGIDIESFIRKFYQIAVKSALKEHVAQPRLSDFLSESMHRYDKFEVHQIVVHQRQDAEEIVRRLTQELEDFSALARSYSVDRSSVSKGGFVGEIIRAELPAILASSVEDIAPAERKIVGPIEALERFYVYCLHFSKASSATDPDTRLAATNEIYTEWLDCALKNQKSGSERSQNNNCGEISGATGESIVSLADIDDLPAGVVAAWTSDREEARELCRYFQASGALTSEDGKFGGRYFASDVPPSVPDPPDPPDPPPPGPVPSPPGPPPVAGVRG